MSIEATNPRSAILAEADSLVNHDRDIAHGSPTENFTRIAGLWAAFLGIGLTAVDVAWMMVLFKAARGRHAPGNRDNYADAAGYIACGWDCATQAEAEASAQEWYAEVTRDLQAYDVMTQETLAEPEPEPEPEIGPRVGQILLTAEDYDALPIGTVIQEDSYHGHRMRKEESGHWRDLSGCGGTLSANHLLEVNAYRSVQDRILELPGGDR